MVLSTGACVRVTGTISLFLGVNLFLVEYIVRIRRGAPEFPANIHRVLPRAPARAPRSINKVVPKSAPPDVAPRPATPPTPSTLIYKVEPDYSREARDAKFQGTIHVSIEVGVDGRVGDIMILDSPGLGLDEKVIEALGKWRFKPATRDGVAVPQKAIVNINFRLT